MEGQGPRRTRTFALTASEAEPYASERISMHSTIRTSVPVEAAGSIPEEWQTVMRWCTGHGIAVAEIAARMQMRLTPTAVLLAELRAHGLVSHQPPMSDADAKNVSVLLRIRNGLEAL